MKTQIIAFYRINTTRLESELSKLSLINEIVNVVRTSEFKNAGPTEGDWADYIVIYK